MDNKIQEKYESLLLLLKEYGPKLCTLAGDNHCFYFYNSIPEKKLRGALNSYAKGVIEDTVIGLVDTTLFGGATEGMLFTTAGIYYDASLHKKFYIKYKDIDSVIVTNPDNKTKDCNKKITIRLKDGTEIQDATGTLYNKTPLAGFINEVSQLAKYGLVEDTDSFIDYVNSDIPEEYKDKCHKIIHTAATATTAPAAGLAQLPCADTFFITPIQVTMVITLGEVFEIRISESTAKSILSGMASSFAGRGLSQVLIGWFPGHGNALNAATAFALTESIGWMAAKHFYSIKLEEDNKIRRATDEVGRAAEEKLRNQAEHFESEKAGWEKDRDEYEEIIDELDKLLEEYEKRQG